MGDTERVLSEMPKVSQDSFDFTEVFRGEYSLDNMAFQRIYRGGVEHQHNHKLPLVLILLGGSTAGKDTTMRPLIDENVLTHSITATSREIRTSGPRADAPNAYVWMDRPTDDEVNEMSAFSLMPKSEKTLANAPEYVQRMVAKYGLIEWNVHHGGTLYGLPEQSLHDAIARNPSSIPIIRTESNGAKTLRGKLNEKFDLLIVGVIPDSYQQLWSRLSLDLGLTYEQVVERFEDSIKINNDLPELVHYYLHNHQDASLSDQENIALSAKALKSLLTMIKLRRYACKVSESI